MNLSEGTGIVKEPVMANQRKVITSQPRSILTKPKHLATTKFIKKTEDRLMTYTETIDQLTLEEALKTKQRIDIIIDQLEQMLREKVESLRNRLIKDDPAAQSSGEDIIKKK